MYKTHEEKRERVHTCERGGSDWVLQHARFGFQKGEFEGRCDRFCVLEVEDCWGVEVDVEVAGSGFSSAFLVERDGYFCFFLGW